MRRITLAIVALAALCLGATAPQPEGIDLGDILQHAPAPALGFIALDVFVDAGNNELAAWQIEYEGAAAGGGAVTLVGVEGGSHPAYAVAPHYDPAALAGGGRIIIAAYTTAADLPSGETRVARLHLAVPAGAEIDHGITLIAAGARAGDRLAAGVRVAPFEDEATENRREDAPQGQDQTP